MGERPRQVVARRRLVELVDQVAGGQTVAVAAPAGWGKSELLVSWERTRRSAISVAWVSLEDGDAAAPRLWRKLLAAVAASTWPDRDRLAGVGVAPEGEVDVGELVEAVTARADDGAVPLVLVVDDVHHLAGGPGADGLALLLRRRPAQWRFVVSGRSLPLPLMRLRVAGLITNIGQAELAFTEAEAAQLFADAGCRLDTADVRALVDCTGGWAAGLRLATMPLLAGTPPQDVIAGVRAGQHDVERYFEEEVLDALPAGAGDFLLATCVAPSLDAGLATLLSGRPDAAALLRELVDAGVFTAADRHHLGGFRYHPLLAESLERHLLQTDPPRHRAQHARVAHWHRERGESQRAFPHAVAAQDWDLAVGLIDDVWITLFVGGDLDRLAGLVAAIPRRRLEADPVLAAIGALAALDRGGGRPSLDAAASRPELVLAIELARRDGRAADARLLAAAALADPPPDADVAARLRAYVLLSVGVAEYWASERADAERDLRDALATCERVGLDYLRLGCLSQLVGVLTAQNRVNDADELAAIAASLAAERGWQGSGWAAELWHALGWIHYLRCDLDAARAHLERAERCVWHQDAVVGTIIPTIGALVASLGGHDAEALALLDLASARLPERREDYLFLAYIDAERARHAIRAGDLRAARELLAGDIAARSLHHAVAAAELAVAEHRLGDARRVLARGLDEAEGYLDQRVHALALLAGLQSGADANDTLLLAVRLAAPEGIIAPFCQVGAPVMRALTEIGRAHHALRPFTTSVRERFRAISDPGGPGGLTARELEVVRLLDGHDTLAEVAARLHVSTNTLKVHTRHLYDKLGVGSRREAVVEATRRGLL
ncbi:MAG: LuxR C-terminal-related transcriptional regulator [Ilumatobacteraceae bacterium]